MAGGHLDMPEHFAAGLKPHSVSEKYYFARGPQLVNRVVDIGPTFETKLACLRSCRTMVTHMIKDLNASLAERKQQVLALSQPMATRLTSSRKWRWKLAIAPPAENSGSTMRNHFTTLGPIDPWTSTSPVMRCLFNQSRPLKTKLLVYK